MQFQAFVPNNCLVLKLDSDPPTHWPYYGEHVSDVEAFTTSRTVQRVLLIPTKQATLNLRSYSVLILPPTELSPDMYILVQGTIQVRGEQAVLGTLSIV